MANLSSYRGAGHLPLPSSNARTTRPRVLLTPPEISSSGLRPATDFGAFRATAARQRRVMTGMWSGSVHPKGNRRWREGLGRQRLITPAGDNECRCWHGARIGAGWGIRPVAHSQCVWQPWDHGLDGTPQATAATANNNPPVGGDDASFPKRSRRCLVPRRSFLPSRPHFVSEP